MHGDALGGSHWGMVHGSQGETSYLLLSSLSPNRIGADILLNLIEGSIGAPPSPQLHDQGAHRGTIIGCYVLLQIDWHYGY